MDRKTYIGSSDAIDLIHGRWQEVWLVKTGRKEPEDLSDVFKVQLGAFTEPFHVEWLRKRMIAAGEIDDEPAYARGKHHRFEPHPFIGATLDAEFGEHPVETKHTGGRKTMSELLDFYMPQLQHHLLVTGAEKLIFSAIMGNEEPVWAWVGRSEEWQERLLSDYIAFWALVEQDLDPAATTPPAGMMIERDEATGEVRAAPPPSTDSVPINGQIAVDMSKNNAWAAYAADYLDNEEAAKSFEAAKKALKEMVQPEHREVYGHGIAITKNKRGALLFSKRAAAAA
jgi:hypothetical protein